LYNKNFNYHNKLKYIFTVKRFNNKSNLKVMVLIILALLFGAGYGASLLQMRSFYNCGAMAVKELAQNNIESSLSYRISGKKEFKMTANRCLDAYHLKFIAINDFYHKVVYISDNLANRSYPLLKKRSVIKSSDAVSIHAGFINSDTSVISFSSDITVSGTRIGDVLLVLAAPFWHRYISRNTIIYCLMAVVSIVSLFIFFKIAKTPSKRELTTNNIASDHTESDHFGPYQKIRKLGSGTMAEVYLVKRERGHFRREFALKIPLPSISPDVINALFEREAVLSAALHHPNIVQIVDFMDDPQAIVMDYVDGKTLLDMMRFTKGALPSAQALFIVMEICKGLECAHSFNIIHRDIKPANILVSYQGEVKISDFGIAKKHEAESNGTMVGNRTKGTYNYMSPEQMLGDIAIGHQTDIYSLGIICYELLTGQKLYDFSTSMGVLQILAVKTEKKIEPLTAVASQTIPEDLNAIVMQSLERNLNKRYQTARDLKRDLEQFKNNADFNYDTLKLSRYMRQSFPKN